MSGNLRSSSTVLLLGQAFQVEGRAIGMDQVIFVAHGAGDLDRQLVVQAVDQVADVVFDIAQM